ncbi:MAG: cytochrome P450 [Methylocella sp.]
MQNGQSGAAVAEPLIIPTEELENDPHAIFGHYRPLVPIIKRSNDGVDLVLRASDIRELITDHRVRQGETEIPEFLGIMDGPLFDLFKYGMLTSNGSDHRRRRLPFSAAFAVRLIADLRPRIRKVAEDLIDSWQAAGEVDFLDRYAAQLPAHIISEILGLPPAEIPHFTSLVYNVSRVFTLSFTAEDVPDMQNSAAQLFDYADRLIEARRATPRDDFLTSSLAAVDESGDLSPIEILIQIASLIIGGSDTTRGALAVEVALLLQHREQWEAVCRDPALVPGAVLEALRFEPIVGSVSRFILEDIQIGDYVLDQGKLVTFSTMSAMRDIELYRDPDTFDIRRTDQQRWPLVFGGGAHRCIGEALAKAELEEGLIALTARLPQLRLAGEPPRLRGHSGIRRIDGMKVEWPTAG